MIGWLIYAMATAALVGVAALAAEWSARASGRSTRWIWSGALVLSVVLPVVAGALLPRPVPAVVRASGAVIGGVVPLTLDVMPVRDAGPVFPLDRLLIAGWALASLALLAWLALSVRRIRRLHRRWTRDAVDGVPVWVSGSTGPAAVGVLRGAIVVPRWALALDRRLRRLMVVHEQEHVRAGDPALALAGLLVCVALPWNLPLWWQLTRLRLAVEVDCDARVLRRVPDASAYGRLLIEVGRRRRRSPALGVAFSRSTSLLERRIRRITERRGGGVARSLAAGLLSVALLALACGTPTPEELAGPDVDDAGSAADPAAGEPGLVLPSSPGCTPVIEIDGERVANDRARLDALDPAGIERIEVVRGPAAIERFGAGTCGGVRIFLKEDAARGVAAGDADAESGRRVLPGDPQPELRVDAERRSIRDGGGEPRFTPFTAEPRLANVEEVRRLLAAAYRERFEGTGIAGTATVWFYLDARGRVVRTRLDRSSGDDALDEAALDVARRMRFEPARNGDEPVPAWVSLPIRFRPQP